MAEHEPLISLGLSARPSPPEPSPSELLPAAETLQFRRAEHQDASAAGSAQRCIRCAQAVQGIYFHAQGKVVCRQCAAALEAWQKAPKPHSLAKAFLYGLGAAVAGGALYAVVWMITGFQIALVAILIGYMVGKAIRHASAGLGGRPQQILAVLLTYFAISISYIPVGIYEIMKNGPTNAKSLAARKTLGTGSPRPIIDPAAKPALNGQAANPAKSPGALLVALIGIALAAPFFSLKSGAGLISLLIIFFGLQRAWRMTGRVEIAITGPYQSGT